MMLEAFDYSACRGVLVPLLPQLYAIMKENAENDKLSGMLPPEHIVLWRQGMKKTLTDIRYRFLCAMDNGSVAGFMTYRFDAGQLYIEDLQIAWAYRQNARVFELIIQRFQSDQQVKACTGIWAGPRVKTEPNRELLAAASPKDTPARDSEALGALPEAVNALKVRYIR